MADPSRYRYAPPDRRSPPLYNPARASMPITSVGYTNSLYGGDISVIPAPHHEPLSSRPVADYHRDHTPTTTTYAVRTEPLGRSTSVRETGGRGHRLPSDEVPSKRPPIIVTTKHAAGSHASSGVRSTSPSRDPYRSSDEGQYYAQPASSISRGRGSAHPHGAAIDNEEYQRLKDRTEHDRLLGPRATDTFRTSRPAVLYNTSHRGGGGTLEFEDEGFEYTKPGELARYDLDHERDRDKPRRSRRESLDRYYRPTVSVMTDLARPYEQNERRQRGPPPTTWGLDKVNRTPAAGIYDGAGVRMPVPPAAPLPPDLARRPGPPETPRSPERRATSRTRPISLIQDPAVRLPHHSDDHYRDQNRDQDRDFYQDGNITSRGFGIRVNPANVDEHRRHHEAQPRDIRRDRRELRKEFGDLELRKRSYDDLDIVSRRYDDRDHGRDRDWERDRDRDKDRDRDFDRERDRGQDRDRDRDQDRNRDRDRDRDRDQGRGRDYDLDRRGYRDRDHDHDRDHDVWADGDARDRKDTKGKEVAVSDDEQESKKEKLRGKVAAGLGIAAASIGIAANEKIRGKDARDERDASPSPTKGRSDDDGRHSPKDGPRPRTSRREPLLDDEDFEIVEHPKDREHPRKGIPGESSVDTRDRNGSIVDGDAVTITRRDHSESTDDGKPAVRRRHRASSAFNPNDTAGLAALKAQLAAQEEKKKTEKPIPTIREPSPERKPAALELPEADDDSAVSASSSRDESRGRELVLPGRDEKQVRVVSPPRDKDDKKPIKGILKQPKPQFPEEPNPIREGVAPHKDDKTKTDVPSGARWTKISRKMVNPEALTIGKERFEVRDDFVIVLRVLSKEEIQAYAAATATLRGGLRIFLSPQ